MHILPAHIEDAAAIRTLMAQVIATSLAGDDALKQDMLANTYKNVAFWLEQPEHCLHLKACRIDGEIVGVILV
ncbi:MAG: hypothetical protein HYZ45_11235, partial [Burkholderiales bacterium]|nr:hypothetical protein [Burkholderiales bacterium]